MNSQQDLTFHLEIIARLTKPPADPSSMRQISSELRRTPKSPAAGADFRRGSTAKGTGLGRIGIGRGHRRVSGGELFRRASEEGARVRVKACEVCRGI